MTPEQLEARAQQARDTIEAIRRARLRRAQERLEALARERVRRLYETPGERLRRRCWSVIVKMHREGCIPAEFYEKHPGLREQLEATVAAARWQQSAKSE